MRRVLLCVLCTAVTLLTACGTPGQGVESSSRWEQAGQSQPQDSQEGGTEHVGQSTEDGASAAQPERDPEKAEEVPLTDLEEARPVLPEQPSPARRAYARVLTDLLEDHVFPDGRPDGFTGDLQAMRENKFALADVDRDGNEELVLRYISAQLRDHRGLVLDYDAQGDRVKIQLDEYPDMTFFENGSVLAYWAAGTGRGGAFLPFSLYVYRPDRDAYSYEGAVDAWDRNVDPEHFPQDVDRSGTGFVYYLLSSTRENGVLPVDAEEYQAWMETIVGEGRIMNLSYMDLTAENIGRITQEASPAQGEADAPAA